MAKNIRKIFKILTDLNLKKTDFVNLMEELKNPYLVLVFCILSLRTKDETTYPAALRLFELANNPKDMMNVSEKKISEAIYPVGFYKNKASQIKRFQEKLLKNIMEMCHPILMNYASSKVLEEKLPI